MRFAALIVVGDGNGSIGIGTGKAAEVPEAIKRQSKLLAETWLRFLSAKALSRTKL